MKFRKTYVLLGILIIAILVFLFSGPRPGHVRDEAMLAGRTAASLNPIAQVDVHNDFFRDMDRGVSFNTKNEINGRNMWILWTGGNDRFWDLSANISFGNVDFLKTLSSYDPDKDSTLNETQRKQLRTRYQFKRANRWNYLGVVNEPCFQQADGPDRDRFGLWLDKRVTSCAPDPFEDESKYPGVKIGARGKNMPVGSYYGYASGIVGLRLFPNPDFDEAAAKKWDPVRYYSDPTYYKSKDLVRPYRVGMACGFCHVSANPIHPPPDPENPGWEHLSSVAGAQYMWIDRVLSWESQPDNYIAQLFATWRPGTVDTSFTSQDNINNPRTMNAIYNVDARMELAKKWGKETLGADNQDSLQLNHYVAADSSLASFFKPPDTVYSMHVLKDGSDSIGVIAALNRVYLNIGLFSEEWLLHFRPLLGGKRTSPIQVKTARKNSVYWQATEDQTFDMAALLLKAGAPHRLSEAVTDQKPATEPLDAGKIVFAERCARCHSSKLPTPPADSNPANCSASDYLNCWNRYWHWTQGEEFKKDARDIVTKADFLDNNYLSTDLRVPVTLLQTNACSPLATNAIAGNIWDEFSSATYKSLPSVGSITYYQPFTGEKRSYQMPAGGRGYTRPPSLVSLWATAPYLQNNSVGPFLPSPSVESRLQSFQASITQMLWPERREQDTLLSGKIPGRIDRTTVPSYLRLPAGYLPGAARPFLGLAALLMPVAFSAEGVDKGVNLGPFPTGTPLDLLANIQSAIDAGDPVNQLTLDRNLLAAVLKLRIGLNNARGKTDEEARAIVFTPDVVEALLKVSKCPDFIVNRGHYFGAAGVPGERPLSDQEKTSLIAFLKTF